MAALVDARAEDPDEAAAVAGGDVFLQCVGGARGDFGDVAEEYGGVAGADGGGGDVVDAAVFGFDGPGDGFSGGVAEGGSLSEGGEGGLEEEGGGAGARAAQCWIGADDEDVGLLGDIEDDRARVVPFHGVGGVFQVERECVVAGLFEAVGDAESGTAGGGGGGIKLDGGEGVAVFCAG